MLTCDLTLKPDNNGGLLTLADIAAVGMPGWGLLRSRAMKRIRHVCQAGTAAERVHALTGGDVLAIADDASVGPLQDIDLPAPRLRAAFWEAVFDGDPDMAGIDWYRELGAIRFQLSTLFS
ncbi:hypothetical protein A3462_00565 [Enterobacter bugandensis]|nr:hypothetical protein A3462_00565 [Enterobacter bugandensis]